MQSYDLVKFPAAVSRQTRDYNNRLHTLYFGFF